MKKKWILVLVLTVVLCVTCCVLLPTKVEAAEIASGTCGDHLTWVLDSSGVLTISGTGEMDDYDEENNPSPWDPWRRKIIKVVIEDGVTSVGNHAFQNCTHLFRITIPGSVTEFGEYVFWGCDDLSAVYLTDLAAWCGIDFGLPVSNPLVRAEYLFVNGELVTDLVIPDGVTRIGKYAFAGFCHILSLTIPESVTTIDDYAFSYCRNLSKVAIPNSVTRIGASAFSDCTGLLDITIPAGVSSIGKGAFSGCDLREVHIKDLSAWCKIDFEDENSTPMKFCTKLFLNGELVTDLVIPDGITSIGQFVFYSCDSLVSVVISDGVTSIERSAFEDCSGLRSLMIPNSVTSIGAYAFSNCGFATITIPDSVTSIGASAFYACGSLTSITFPDSVKSIGNYALSSCKKLTKVVLPNGLKTIPGWMFQYCTNLAVVIIPHSVNMIQSGAFAGCENLWHVLFTGTKWQWSNVFITQYADDSTTNLKSATLHYNYTGSQKVEACYKASTCSEEGERLRSCELCGVNHSEVIPKREYNHYGGIWTSIDEELHKWDCPYCDEEGTEAHSWWHGTITKVPTCVADGEIRSICDRCGVTKTGPIAAKGHSYQKITAAPTCTEQGCTTYICLQCDDSYTEDYLDAVGHSYGEWKETKAPTVVEPGIEERKCENCDAKEQRELAKLEPPPTKPKPTMPKPTAPKATEPIENEAPGNDGDFTAIIIIVVAAVLVCGGGVGAVVILLRKKK